MIVWDWECFDRLLVSPFCEVVEAGPLRGPIRQFTIRRDKERNLILEVLAAGELSRKAPDHPIGTVRRLTEVVRFESATNLVAFATGVTPRATTDSRNADGAPQSRQIAHVQRLEIRLRTEVAPSFVVDWLENLDGDGAIWMGETVRTHSQSPVTRSFGSGTGVITFTGKEAEQDDSSRSVLEVEVGGVRLFICQSKQPNLERPGYIVYEGAPDEDVRKKIRDVLGFCLGCGLVYLGSTTLGAGSELISTVAVAGNPFGDRIFQSGGWMPAPLGKRFVNEVDQSVLSEAAAALFKHYDELDFGALSWAYWHATCAPMHMAAGHFGAAIEALQQTYINNNKPARLSKLIGDKALSQQVVEALLGALRTLEIEANARRALEQKISSINSASGALVSERIFAALNLALGPLERAAWQRRNDAAHGNRIQADDVVEIIRDTKLLRILLNRMVLRIASASSTYVDTYTVGHRTRPLAQSVNET